VKFVEKDPRYYRPAEVDLLVGDPSKAKSRLGWEAKTKFKDLVRLMVDADVVEVGGERKKVKDKVEAK
jgi:GDPmannose 4,6-dehydratase